MCGEGVTWECDGGSSEEVRTAGAIENENPPSGTGGKNMIPAETPNSG